MVLGFILGALAVVLFWVGYSMGKSEEKEKRIESPDYPESQEEWEECGWDIDKEEQKLKSEEKGR